METLKFDGELTCTPQKTSTKKIRSVEATLLRVGKWRKHLAGHAN
jgi:hypothetical protein